MKKTPTTGRQIKQPETDSKHRSAPHAGTLRDFERFFHLPAYMVCIISPDGFFQKISPSFPITLGFSESELLDKPFLEFIHPDDEMPTVKAMRKLIREMLLIKFTNRYKCKDCSYKWFEWTARSFVNGGEIYAIAYDVTEHKLNEQKLKQAAHYDLLTNLPNRVLLAERLSQAMLQCQRSTQLLAVAFLDLDGFKAVNDTHGHRMGDELLITVSRRLEKALRRGDTLARIGGDEFIIVMIDLESPNDKKNVLSRLLKAAATPVVVGDIVMQVTASIGVTLYPQHGLEADQLIRQADNAMYVAKQAGKNRYQLFDTAQDSATKVRCKMIEDVRSALAKHEFVLHYQPKVNMRTGEVIGVEALIRWLHPIRGLITPAVFLPAIESHDISLKLGEWVINTALNQASQWKMMGLNLPISVNISAYQLQQENFTACLAELLAAYPEIDIHSLELEILETSALHDTEKASVTMNACRKLGVRFALDDFGTGYSSLSYLKSLPAYLIKIDQSFVRNMLEDTDDLAIVEGIVGLAKAFRREVIAEGVETNAHGTALLQLGCELAQGYGIARPMPAKDILKWVSCWKKDDFLPKT